jgi:hypothetical protein
MGLGSGIRKQPILDPGSRGQKGTGSQIRIRNTGGGSIIWKTQDKGLASYSNNLSTTETQRYFDTKRSSLIISVEKLNQGCLKGKCHPPPPPDDKDQDEELVNCHQTKVSKLSLSV